MKNKLIKKLGLSLSIAFTMLCTGNQATAQYTQYVIGGPSNELATKIVHMSDGSDVIAGYQYALSGGVATNLDAIIMRVSSSGTILWQKKYWQTTGSSADIFNDVIVSNDGNIVAVGTTGRTSMYSTNHAAIIKINALTGATIWSKVISDAGSSGGEVFYGVAEYYDASGSGYYLAAVGARNFGIGTSSGLIAVFNSASGAFQYDEYYFYHPDGAQYQSAVTNAAGDGIYVCGQATISNYGDGIVFSYIPNVASSSGTKPWENWYDFTTVSGFNSSFFSRISRYGTTLIMEGGALQNYCTSCGSGQFIFRVSTSGTSADVTSVINNAGYYANAPAYTVFTDNHVITAQTPAGAGGWFDPVTWGTVGSANSVVTDIYDVTARLYNPPVQFGGSNTNKAIYSMDNDHISHIYMAGTVPGSTFGLNDIYYVKSNLSFTSVSGNIPCDKLNAFCNLDPATTVSVTPAIDQFSFTPSYSTLHEIGTFYNISLLCGDPGTSWGTFRPANTNIADDNIAPKETISIYPNPANDVLNIAMEEDIKTIQLFDFSGKKVLQFYYADNTRNIKIQTGKLVPGNYMLLVNNSITKVVTRN